MKLDTMNRDFEPEYRRVVDELTRQFLNYLNSPQYGICGYVVWLVSKKLLEVGVQDFKVVEGTVDTTDGTLPHTWIERTGRIYDPTSAQFPDGYEVNHDEYYRELSPTDYVEVGPDEYGYETH